MELWIRSQDKDTLKLAEMLDIYDLSDDEGQCWAIEESGTTIGYYKSKKRALEVLDEIQRILQPKTIAYIRPSEEMVELLGGRQVGKVMKMQNDMKIEELSTYVYEMPKE